MIVGLHGPIGAGKDTVTAHLRAAHDFNALSFAGPVKDMLVALGISRETIEDRTAKEQPIEWLGKSPRDLMRSLGTEWGRGLVRPDLWIRHAEQRLKYHHMISPHVVFTDVRYEDEAAFVRSQGGRIWHLFRSTVHYGDSGHSSDVPLFIYRGDSILRNDSTLDSLHAQIDRAIAGDLVVGAPLYSVDP